jgi:hypothetical protein
VTAIISKDGKYRYWLERKLSSPIKNTCVFIMLNPSTADAELDDPTIRRCKGFAERFQCGKLVVVNLFAYRATRPADLYKAKDPVGKENDKHLAKALALPGMIICGWGANDVNDRAARLKAMADWQKVNLCCLGKTKSGAPKHPLYLPALAPLEVL